MVADETQTPPLKSDVGRVNRSQRHTHKQHHSHMSQYSLETSETVHQPRMRAGLGLMTAFLGLATVVQVNDPDALIWMSVYGLPALLTLCVFLKTSLLESGWWWGCCAVIFSGDLLFTGIVMAGYLQQQALTWNIVSTEEGRESAGLMIVLLWLLILLFSSSSLRNESFWKRNIFLAYTIIPVASWIAYKYYIQKNITVPEHCEGVI